MNSTTTSTRARTRLAVWAALAAVLAWAATMAAPVAAHADGATFTWTCTDHNADWTDASCWDVGAAPQDGDSVVIDTDTPITNTPLITLTNLTYTGGYHAHIDSAYDVLGGITVTGRLEWTGGALNVPLTIGPGASATLGVGTPKSIGGNLTVHGTLTLDSTGTGDGGGLTVGIPKLTDEAELDVLIDSGATLIAHGPNVITGSRCCSAARPTTVQNHGTISVPDGSLTLQAIALDQGGAVSVGHKARLDVTDAVARLRGGSSYQGPGTLAFNHANQPSPDPKHPENNQGAVLLEGTATLSHQVILALTDGTDLTGVGTFAGTGTVRLKGTTVYGKVHTKKHVALDVLGHDASQVDTWTHQSGYVGHLTLGGPSTVHKGATLNTDAGTVTTVARGGSLTVPAGAHIAASTCCSKAPTLVNAKGGTLRLGGGSGKAATIRWNTLRNDGTIDVRGATIWTSVTAKQPRGTLRLDARLTSDGGYAFGKHSTLTIGLHGKHAGRLVLHGTARLAGTLRTAGSGSHKRGRHLTAIKSGGRHGTFSCARTPGWKVTYSRKGVRLTGLGRSARTRCGHSRHNVARATPAHALTLNGQIVFDRGNDIWAANADGSGAHPLVTAAQVGMDHLGEPATAPDGNVLLFTGWTDANKTVSSHDVEFWGNNWHGTYELHNGVVTRLSAAPKAVDLPEDTNDMTPEPAQDGKSYVYAHLDCTEQVIVRDGYGDPVDWDRVCTSQLRRAPLPGGAAHSSSFATSCDGDVFSLPYSPTPDPAAPGRIAYSGCQSPASSDPFAPPQQGVLMISGPARQGEVTVASTGEARSFDDPSFSPDGEHLVAYNEGGEVDTLRPDGTIDLQQITGGLYVYDDLSTTSPGRLLVRAPANGTDGLGDTLYTQLTYPRYLGPDTIGFVANGSVYAVAATCSACTLASATKLHDGGSTFATQASSLAWTTRTIKPARSVHLSLAKVPTQHVHALLKHGLRVKATCRRACGLTLALTVTAKQARTLHLISKSRYRTLRKRHQGAVRIGHKSVHLRAGKHTTIRIVISHKARRTLAKAHRWTMRVTGTPSPGGASAARHRIVQVRR